ncbi:MAG: NAD(P)H-hydrate epimerase, partial [Comamonadaceae bacterium]
MRRITSRNATDLHDVAGTRRIEAAAAARLAPHALMGRAGAAVARLALALAPHARCIWIACGPGNNGGDGLVAATELHRLGARPIVTLLGSDDRRPPDAAAALARAREAGVRFSDAPPAEFDLSIDALLGIGAARPIEGDMASWLIRMRSAASPLLSIDVPSGLDADTGHSLQRALHGEMHRAGPRHCLSLLTLKPGLFTADGRDLAGEVWLDSLDTTCDEAAPVARLGVARPVRGRLHASHKGSYGDVAVIGGAPGMAGAAWLAAAAALH